MITTVFDRKPNKVKKNKQAKYYKGRKKKKGNKYKIHDNETGAPQKTKNKIQPQYLRMQKYVQTYAEV